MCVYQLQLEYYQSQVDALQSQMKMRESLSSDQQKKVGEALIEILIACTYHCFPIVHSVKNDEEKKTLEQECQQLQSMVSLTWRPS